jgi:hypothetical protein
MVALPQKTPEEKLAELNAWYTMKTALNELKQTEMMKRKFVAPMFFPAPEEGTNKADIGLGYELVLKHSFNYKTDEGALDASAASLRKAGIKVDELFVYKPELKLAVYRALTPEQKLLLQSVITITEASPDLSIRPVGDPTLEQLNISVPTPIAPAAPAGPVEYVMAPLAGDFTEEDFIAQGWTREMLVDKGYMIPCEPEQPPKPRARRGRKPKAK